MKYKIGDVSKVLGISPDLLRYYQKKGVVSPSIGENNNYRYYDAWDINFLIDCLWFKNLGFGIEQTAKLVAHSSYDEILSDIDNKEQELRDNIIRAEMMLQRTAQYTSALRRSRRLLGKCTLVYSPEIYRYLNRFNREYENIRELQDLSHQWLSYMPFLTRSFEISRTDLANKTDNYAWGYAMDMQFVRALNVPLQEPVAHLPSEPSVHTVFTSSGKTNFSPRHLKPAMDYIRANNLVVNGNARGNLIASIVEDGELRGYFDVWIPIEPREDLHFLNMEQLDEA